MCIKSQVIVTCLQLLLLFLSLSSLRAVTVHLFFIKKSFFSVKEVLLLFMFFYNFFLFLMNSLYSNGCQCPIFFFKKKYINPSIRFVI